MQKLGVELIRDLSTSEAQTQTLLHRTDTQWCGATSQLYVALSFVAVKVQKRAKSFKIRTMVYMSLWESLGTTALKVSSLLKRVMFSSLVFRYKQVLLYYSFHGTWPIQACRLHIRTPGPLGTKTYATIVWQCDAILVQLTRLFEIIWQENRT
jgi:hypothetical protein